MIVIIIIDGIIIIVIQLRIGTNLITVGGCLLLSSSSYTTLYHGECHDVADAHGYRLSMRSSIDIDAMDIDVRCEVVSIRNGYRYSMLSTIDRRAWERRSDVVIDGSLMEWKYGSMEVRMESILRIVSQLKNFREPSSRRAANEEPSRS